MTRLNISFAGAGRVAEALCREMFGAGHRITAIASRNGENGRALAARFNTRWSDSLAFSDDCDLIIVAVPDNCLEKVLSDITCSENTIVVHTAGSYSTDIFPVSRKRKGVLYPLQTFTKGRYLSLSGVPFFIEASDAEAFDLLDDLVGSVGGKVYAANAADRKMLHLAAVFACNFVNHNLTVAGRIAGMAGFGFPVLEPLLRETVEKACENGPGNSQTGPAARGDTKTISGHLELLSFAPDLKEMYTATTGSIMNQLNNKTRNDQF